MKHITLIAAIATLLAAGAQAQDSKPEHEVGYNIAAVSDYRYRGISQTRLKPALQSGVDYTHHPSGWYAGTWLSTIRWIRDTPGAGETRLEWDVYGGKRGELGGQLTYDVGGLGYIYPGNKFDRISGLVDADTFELYGQVGFGPAYVKYSHALTNLFGVPDSRHSGYLDVGANVEVGGGVTLNLHAGRQRVRNGADYNDWKLGATRDFGFANLSLALIGTNIEVLGPNGKNLSDNRLVLAATKTF